jgi:hypothetical protein
MTWYKIISVETVGTLIDIIKCNLKTSKMQSEC